MIKLRSLIPESFYLHGYTRTQEDSKFKKPENFDKFTRKSRDKLNVYCGGNDWEISNTWAAAHFNENYDEQSRVWFEIKYPAHLEGLVGEGISDSNPAFAAIQEWGRKATKRWITEARRYRYATREKIIPESYRWNYKKWNECFIEALNSPRMKLFVKNWGVDSTHWKAMKPYEEEYGDNTAQEKHP